MLQTPGRPVGSFRNGRQDTTAYTGNDLITSLDVDLQSLAEQLMQNKSGSIVAIEPSSGEILSIISSPTYDPNVLTIDSFNLKRKSQTRLIS